MQTKRTFFITAAPLLLVLFIDGMGLSLVVPPDFRTFNP